MTALALTPDRLAREQQLCAAGWPYHPETPCARCGAAPNQECQMAPNTRASRDRMTAAEEDLIDAALEWYARICAEPFGNDRGYPVIRARQELERTCQVVATERDGEWT